MAKSKNKNSISSFIKKLNEIDVNSLIASLNNIDFKDLKKIDFKDLSRKIRRSDLFKPALGLFGGSLLFVFLLIPSFEQLISSFEKSKRYQEESNSLLSQRLKIKQLELKLKKSNLLLSEIDKSIISKDNIIFISKLINETALKSNVNIVSISPVEAARSSKLCRETTQTRKSRQKNNNITKKGSFQENSFEINLLSNYLDLIKFLNNIQDYNVVILPSCLEVVMADNPRSKQITSENNINPSKIIPLSESGTPIDIISFDDRLNSNSSFNKVKIRLVFKIPSHTR
tara:strand:+ start:294 stop:1151 length:858 start_codon:yes stop_codon:yes gene_type:complete